MQHTDIDVLLICALKDEYTQVLNVTDGLISPGWEEHPDSNGWIVADGQFSTHSGPSLSIRTTHADHMGREAVQAVASNILHTQAVRCIAMSGICAGRRGEVALGDVIFADRLWSYDAGKIKVRDGKQHFQGDWLQYRPSPTWKQRMDRFAPKLDSEWLLQRPTPPLEYQEDWVLLRLLAGEEPHSHPDFNSACPNWVKVLPRLRQRQWIAKLLVLTEAGREHAEELVLLYRQKLPDPPAFQTHVAPMATGAAVMEDAGIFDRLAELSERKVLGIEMEASALGALGEIHDLPVLVAKAVSDYGDAFKDDRYRTFAARAAAECLIGLLRESADLLPGRGKPDLTNGLLPSSEATPKLSHLANGLTTGFPWLPSHERQRVALIDLRQTLPAHQAVVQAFGTASQQLLSWPQLTKGDKGEWIDRPELEKIHNFICAQRENDSETRNIIALLGSPGTGKSALLARLGEQLTKNGIFLLAIKADMLPKTINTIDDLVFGSPAPILDCLRSLVFHGKTVLLIDQLDALCELMDQHTNRLRILLALLSQASNLPNLKIVVSCRAFEYEHDTRISTLKSDKLELRDLAWQQIQPILKDVGINTSNWPDAIQKILCTPQHLTLYLRHLADTEDTDNYQTYQDMLARVVERRIIKPHGQKTLAAAIDIAASMAEEEELWLDRVLWIGSARFERLYATEIDHLLEAEILVRKDARRIAFRHQTWYEYFRGRGFVENGGGIAEFVLARQDALFVRPTLWCAMHYLRADNLTAYRVELSRLWNEPCLRTHVRMLLIEFLAQLPNPDDIEATWLLPVLNDAPLRTYALRAMQGNSSWFRRLKFRQLPMIMSGNDATSWEAVGILHTALNKNRDDVLLLIERHWSDSRWAGCVFRVLDANEEWDARSIELIQQRVKEINGYWLANIATKIAKQNPEAAARLISEKLWHELAQVKANVQPPPEPAGDNDNLLVWQIKANLSNYEPFTKLLSEWELWHKLDKLASNIPEEFLSVTWPWFLEVFELISVKNSSSEYRCSASYMGSFESSQYLPSDSARSTLMAAVKSWAESKPNSYLDFVMKNQSSDLMFVHYVLAWGLVECAETYPESVANYLIGDKRRLTIGGSSDRHEISKELLGKATPHLKGTWRKRVEDFIIAYKHCDDFEEDTPQLRFNRTKWNREHRLRLLKVIPDKYRSTKYNKLIELEDRALGPVSDYGMSVRSGWSESPMSHEKMLKATDNQILHLFKIISEKKRRYSKEFDDWKMVEASRVFAKFAEANPEAALSIIQQLQPQTEEMPAGYALAELGKTNLSPDRLITCIIDLDSKGFKSNDFRHGAASCLEAIAWKQDGLDEHLCSLLISWLVDSVSPSIIKHKGSKANEQRQTIIWNKFGSRIVPSGNVPVLQTLMPGLLRRNPMDADGWLNVLEQHLNRREEDEVWGYFAWRGDLDYLQHADREKAIAFFYRLAEQRPQLMNSPDGVYLLARSHRWLPPEFTYQLLDNWLQSDWPLGKQAAGELILLRHFLHPEDEEIARRCEAALTHNSLTGDLAEIRLGISFTAAELWGQEEWRRVATPILEKLALLANEEIAESIMSVFWGGKEFLFDEATERLLNLLADRPELLKRRSGQLLDRLKEGLQDGGLPHGLVLRVASALAERNADEIGNPQTRWALHSGDLVDIALTLQRNPETRSAATKLFEQLLEIGAHTIEGTLKQLDCRL